MCRFWFKKTDLEVTLKIMKITSKFAWKAWRNPRILTVPIYSLNRKRIVLEFWDSLLIHYMLSPPLSVWLSVLFSLSRILMILLDGPLPQYSYVITDTLCFRYFSWFKSVNHLASFLTLYHKPPINTCYCVMTIQIYLQCDVIVILQRRWSAERSSTEPILRLVSVVLLHYLQLTFTINI